MRLFCRKTGVRVLGLAALSLAMLVNPVQPPAQAQVSIGVSVNFAPPALPVYEQPLCPGEGYLWTPGYWAWDPDYRDYYWVPGTWVRAPRAGYLWTPPWWGWNGVAFVFHDGYWGQRVGFYGGIDYGYGYTSRGYYGGRWERDRFYYNRNVNNVNVTQVRNVYNTTVVNNVNVTRVSYNGGNGGIQERATVQEQQAERERHVTAVAAQQQHIREARADRALRASDNRGKPPIAATVKPADFRGAKVAAKAGNYTPPPDRGANRAANANQPNANQPGANRPELSRAPNANRPAPTPAPNANRPAPNTAPNAQPDVSRQPEKRSDRPPNATKPASRTDVQPSAGKPVPKENRPEANRPAPNVNPRSKPDASPNRPEANRPAPNSNPPRTTPNTPSRPPNATNPNSNERRQQEERMKQQDQQRQRVEQQKNQDRARSEQQQRANETRKPQQEPSAQQQHQQEQRQQQPKAQAKPRPQPQPQAQPQPKQKPPKQQDEKPHGKGGR